MANLGEQIYDSSVWMSNPHSEYSIISTENPIPITFGSDTHATIWGNGGKNTSIDITAGTEWFIVGRDNSAISNSVDTFIIRNSDNKYAAVRIDTNITNASLNEDGEAVKTYDEYARAQYNGLTFIYTINDPESGAVETINSTDDYNKFVQDSQAVIDATKKQINDVASQKIEQTFDNVVTAFGESIVTPVTSEMDTTEVSLRMEPTIWTYGLPPQWTKYVDPRVMGFTTCQNTSAGVVGPEIPVGLGRRYTGVIISNPTILEIAPGYMRYAKWMNKDQTFLDALNAYKNMDGFGAVTETVGKGLISQFESHSSKFYTIKPCFNDNAAYSVGDVDDKNFQFGGYISYVKYLMILAAVFLSRSEAQRSSGSTTVDMSGTTYLKFYSDREESEQVSPLSNRIAPRLNTQYKKIDWQKYNKHSGYLTIGGFVLGATGGANNGDTSSNAHESAFDYMKFYLSGSTSAQDSFSTDVEESFLGQLATTVNAAMKETAYWLGSDVGGFAQDLVSTAEGIINAVSFKGSNPLGGIFNVAEMMGGGKIVFPQIITNSKYGKSIECECTFASIYGDEEALYLNTIMPYMHLLAFVLPHQVRTSLEMYTFPFIVKAFCRGLFNVEMGAITSFSVQRGGGDNSLWSFNGAAEIVTVNFEITPLISNLVMTSSFDGAGWLLKNTGLQEYMSAITAFDARNDNFELAYDILTAGLGGSFVSKLSSVLTPLAQNEVVSSIINFERKLDAYNLSPLETVRGLTDTLHNEYTDAADNFFRGIVGAPASNSDEQIPLQESADHKLIVG